MSTDGVIVLTGASSGIGAVAARELAALGRRVVVVGRNPERTRAVAAEVSGDALLADYDRLDDVRGLAATILERYDRIGVLLNNAGGLVPQRALTEDGFERTIQHNHLAPFLLTGLLLPRLEQSGGRVIGTASIANRFGWLRLDDLDWQRHPWLGGWPAYGTSKLATVLFMRELARRMPRVEAFSVHPGFVRTSFGTGSRAMAVMATLTRGGYGISAEAGAAPLVALASTERPPAASGTYFDMLRPNGRVAPQAHDAALARDLWIESASRVGLPY
ncbi:SDR family NAD(P)-dependent oxidoreductase [Herbiconiux sp. SYSU D00978]|uniref:SDR family NAD(P)-dependent oxidoreductase n=1 Tax=Herbiconiux sp. SYSU D00978 TaxID=2812562 RepID=UPI001A969BEE|nr:SDR family NAD(P)-dependent oxidoreductase [Herbiconiux sp. SYSU D00978]